MIQSLKEVIALTAQYYGRPIDANLVIMYADDLSDYPSQDVINAYKTYRKDPKNKHFPLPAQIIEILSPTVSSESEAQMAASLVYEAISRFGYTNGPRAKEFIGELGWKVVKRMGGWQTTCESLGVTYDRSAFMAHAKSIAKSEREFSHAGREDDKPQLSHIPRKESGLESASQILNFLDFKKNKPPETSGEV